MKICRSIFFLFGYFVKDVLTKPTQGKHIEPCANPLECLHGVLMHGDDNSGDSHKTEDSYLKFKSVLKTGPKDKDGPKDAEEVFHGALMHGSRLEKNEHDKLKTNQPVKPPDDIGPKDTNKIAHDMMHGDIEKSHDHNHNKEPNVKQSISPPDAEEIMHEVLMHSNDKVQNHHVHSKPEEAGSKSKQSPMDQNNMMHNLMHNGKSKDHSIDKPSDIQVKFSGPNSDQLHGVLMHGDSDAGHNHEDEHKKSKNVPFKFNIKEIKKLGIDPDILKTVFQEDKEDYKKWKDENQRGSENYEASYASVSDIILSNIELMKKRYLAKKSDQEEEEMNAYLNAKDRDLVADDLVKTFDNIDHEDDDMRHDLELIGSTEPISEIHHHRDLKQKQEM